MGVYVPSVSGAIPTLSQIRDWDVEHLTGAALILDDDEVGSVAHGDPDPACDAASELAPIAPSVRTESDIPADRSEESTTACG